MGKRWGVYSANGSLTVGFGSFVTIDLTVVNNDLIFVSLNGGTPVNNRTSAAVAPISYFGPYGVIGGFPTSKFVRGVSFGCNSLGYADSSFDLSSSLFFGSSMPDISGGTNINPTSAPI